MQSMARAVWSLKELSCCGEFDDVISCGCILHAVYRHGRNAIQAIKGGAKEGYAHNFLFMSKSIAVESTIWLHVTSIC
jgi:hypothetical protein